MTTVQLRTNFWNHIYSEYSIPESSSTWCIRHGINPKWRFDSHKQCFELDFYRDTDLTLFRLRYGEFEI